MKYLWIVFGIICFISAYIMYSLRNDSHLSELGDFFWIPLPLGALLILFALKAKPKNDNNDNLLD
ncbi:MAG: hypothetical protein ACK476_18690 [Fluviicola sp.]|jgi:hypothetical protein